MEHIDHTRTKGKRPPTHGIVQRLPKPLLQEGYRMTCRKKLSTTLTALQTDLEEGLRDANAERIHQRRWG